MEEWIRWSVGIIVTTILTVVGVLGYDRIRKIEEDLAEVKKDMSEYTGNCGVSKAAMEALDAKITQHIDREETILWGEIREDRKLNREAHEHMLNALTILATRTTRVETILDERLPAKAVVRKRK